MTLNEKKKLYLKANAAYMNTGTTLMSDKEFDQLEKEIREADPEWAHLKKTGSKVGKKVEVRLACYMPSLRKVYPEDLPKWLKKQKSMSQLEMHKLDGSALQLEYMDQRPVKLVTRGDGTLGKNISFLIPYLNLPRINEKGRTILRCEAVMKEALFQSKWSVKKRGEKEGFEHARGMVNGLLNRTRAHAGMKDIDIVVLGVYSMEMRSGLDWAERQGLTVVKNSVIGLSLIGETRLKRAREASEYLIDGLVYVAPTQVFDYDSADKPKWITAFKVNEDLDDAAQAIVKDVIWQASRTGRWTPKIEIKPMKIGSVTVTYATAHNAVWMTDRRIGVGAVVKLVRSGDVIPKIVGVVKPAIKPSHPPGEFYEKGVHYYATERSKVADVREIHHFMTTLGIEHIAQKTISKLYDAGLCDVLAHVNSYGLRMHKYEEAGIGNAMTSKIHDEFRRVLQDEGVTLIKMMNASNCFESFGERKLQMIENSYTAKGVMNILSWYVRKSPEWLASERNWDAIKAIKGMGDASARQFFEGLQEFQPWFLALMKTKLIKINKPQIKKAKAKGLPLSGQYVSWTGYRSEDEEKEVEALGGEVIKLGAKTTILLYNPKGKFMGKVEDARSRGIRVTTFGELNG